MKRRKVPMQDLSEPKTMIGTLKVEGEIAIQRVVELKQQILAGFTGASAVELDLEQVDDIDGAGIQLLLFARRIANDRGITLRLRAPSEVVLDALRLLRLIDDFGLAAEPTKGPQ